MNNEVAAFPDFPTFDLVRLLRTVFEPVEGNRICVLIDLPDPKMLQDFAFLSDPELTIQKIAYEDFYCGLQNGAREKMGMTGGEIFAYALTGGSNLDLPDELFDLTGAQLTFEEDIFPHYDIILCISTFSATAPLTAFAKQYGFRGATLHGVNDIIRNTGLVVDYEAVSNEAEKLRLGMTRADWFEIDYKIDGRRMTLRLLTEGQEAQKSHGLCRGTVPDVANLPAGEVYFVPRTSVGEFPLYYDDGTLGILEVADGRVQKAKLLRGSQPTIDEHNARLKEDPSTGVIGELGFGTQKLPFSGRDIQDEKILGTFHVATGRSDHLGGDLDPSGFVDKRNATHDDILFAPHKTPEVEAEVRMLRAGKVEVLIQGYEPSPYLLNLLT